MNDGEERKPKFKKSIGGAVTEKSLSRQGNSLPSPSASPIDIIMAIIPDGCILVARKIKESEIWGKPAWWWKVFTYLILDVSYKATEKKPRGQGFFQYKVVFKECNLSKEKGIKPESINNVVRWMRKVGICTTQKTTRGIIITLCNYSHYQNIANYRNQTENHRETRQKPDRNHTIPKEGNKGKNVRIDSKPKGSPITDLDFLSTLKTNTAYKGIDIDNELARMDAWLATRPGRKKTRRFIVNWLNKVDKPIGLTEAQSETESDRIMRKFRENK